MEDFQCKSSHFTPFQGVVEHFGVTCGGGLQVNALDTLGQTALHRAALAGHLQTCRLLLGYGADASLVSLQGFTAAQMGNEAVQQILSGV